MSFVPAAPTEASILADLVVAASSIFGGSWLEGAGAVHAENEALDFLAGELGMPESTGGVLVTGGTAGNLSALIVARDVARRERGRPDGRWVIATSEEAHSSVASAAAVLDVDIITIPPDADRRLTGANLTTAIEAMSPAELDGLFAVVATAGTTNLGIVDDIAGLADVCAAHRIWLHVDGAYGAAAVLVPETRSLFDGCDRADSVIIDPHKWLFAPFDCCALLYRDPRIAATVHTQKAGYLDVLADEYNPSDLAYHLTRRPRGVPFWFSLATHGVGAYRAAVADGLDLAHYAREHVEAHPDLELIEPCGLSVVAFRRAGWGPNAYREWSERLLRRGLAFVTPTKVDGEVALRFCFVNPRTTTDDIDLILSTLTD